MYLLSRASDASVKVRDGLMDVKRLERVERRRARAVEAGHEGRVPALRRRTSPRCSTALGVARPALARAEYTLDELVAEVVEPSADLLAVAVHKRREHYTIGGCMAERRRCGPRRARRARSPSSRRTRRA